MKRTASLFGLLVCLSVLPAPSVRRSVGQPMGSPLPARSLNFPGDAAVIVPHSSSLNLSTQASVFAWVKFTDTSANLGIVGKSNYTEGRRCYALETWASSAKALGVVSSNGTTLHSFFGGDTINDGVWHHIGFTYNEGTTKVYVDSILRNRTDLTPGTIPSLSQDATTELTLGSILDGDTPTLHFKGKIFRPIITNIALSQAQVTELFDLDRVAGNGRISSLSFFSNVMAAYAFDARDSLASVKDDSGNGNHGVYDGDLADYSTDVPSNIAAPSERSAGIPDVALRRPQAIPTR